MIRLKRKFKINDKVIFESGNYTALAFRYEKRGKYKQPAIMVLICKTLTEEYYVNQDYLTKEEQINE